MSGIVSNRRRVTRRRDDRTPLLSFVSENRFNQRLRKVEEDAEVRELELDYELFLVFIMGVVIFRSVRW